MTADIIFLVREDNLTGKASRNLRRELSAMVAPGRRLILDLSTVEKVDSLVANWLLEIAETLRMSGGYLKLVGLQNGVAAFLELLRVHHRIEMKGGPVQVASMAIAA